MYKVLIAEESIQISKELAQRLSGSCSVRVRQEGEDILRLTEELEADVVVLDMMLPGIDGIDLLSRLKQLPHCPCVLATVRYTSGYMMQALTTLGADYIMSKPCIVDNMLMRVKDLLCYRFCVEIPEQSDGEEAYDHARRLGVAPKLKGSKYLQTALCLLMQNPNQQITKELYPAVGAVFHVSADRVERCIRHAIHLAWERRDDRIWRMYFTADTSGQIPRPTNAQFMARLLERIRFVA